MKSSRAKVLHEVFHAPMLHHVLRALQPLKPEQNIVVVGHQKEKVGNSLADFSVSLATQTEQLGTGHAVLAAESVISTSESVVMILCGDTPLILPETLSAMHQHHVSSGATLTLMTTILEKPTNYGRIVSTDSGKIKCIVEEKDADANQKEIKEVNTGIYCVNQDFLFSTLKQVGTNNSQGEVYLTDIVGIAVEKGLGVEKFVNSDPIHVLGVNSRVELAQAHHELLMRRNHDVMMQGVTMYQPESITIEETVQIGEDCILHPNVTLLGNTKIGKNCVLHNGAIIVDGSIEDNVVIGPYCYVEDVCVAGEIKAHSYLGKE